jgi:hypothetical protein
VDLGVVNERVDKALADNRRAELLVISMAMASFLLGLAVVLIGYRATNPYVSTMAVPFQGLLYLPIREIVKLRRDNLILQTVPAIVTALPARRASDEIVRTLEFLRRK